MVGLLDYLVNLDWFIISTSSSCQGKKDDSGEKLFSYVWLLLLN